MFPAFANTFTLLGFPGGSDGKKSARKCRRPVQSLGSEDVLKKEMAAHSSIQYSCLENPMDRGVWQATAHGVAKSWTRLRNLTQHPPLT